MSNVVSKTAQGLSGIFFAVFINQWTVWVQKTQVMEVWDIRKLWCRFNKTNIFIYLFYCLTLIGMFQIQNAIPSGCIRRGLVYDWVPISDLVLISHEENKFGFHLRTWLIGITSPRINRVQVPLGILLLVYLIDRGLSQIRKVWRGNSFSHPDFIYDEIHTSTSTPSTPGSGRGQVTDSNFSLAQ